MNAPIGLPPQPLTLTDDQYEAMARRGAFNGLGRIELRRGMLIEMSPVDYNHSVVFGALFLAASRAIEASGTGLRALPEISIRFGGGFQPTPDIVIWDPAAAPPFDGPIPAEVVRLVIEVAQASLGDDLGDKLMEYAKAGVQEYWVADVQARLIYRCISPCADGYTKRDAIRFGEPATALTFALTLDTGSL